MKSEDARTVPPVYFAQLLAVNVDNESLSDAEFRAFVRNTLPIVIGAEVKNEKGK